MVPVEAMRAVGLDDTEVGVARSADSGAALVVAGRAASMVSGPVLLERVCERLLSSETPAPIAIVSTPGLIRQLDRACGKLRRA